MSKSSARPGLVYLALMLVTIASLALTADSLQGLLSSRVAFSIAAIIAFVKARYVALDFMALRGTPIMKAFDAWLLVAGGVSLLLILR